MSNDIFIGIHGKKRSGKTTVAEGIIERVENEMPYAFDDIRIVSFADKLKNVVRDCFGTNEFIDIDAKDTLLACGKTYRQVLQIVGTDMFRSLWPDVWVNALQNSLRTYDDNVKRLIVIHDVRFPNEAQFVLANSGFLIKLQREPGAFDAHTSEHALDSWYNWSAIICNSDMTIEEQLDATWSSVKPWLVNQIYKEKTE